jgi:hypothetical protein
LAGVDAAAGDTGLDAALAQRQAAPAVGIALVGVELVGPFARAAAGLGTGGTASSRVASTVESCGLAALRCTASGVPRRSTSRGRLVPGLPRSVGFGPVWAPLLPPAYVAHLRWRGASPLVRPRRGGRATLGAGAATRPLRARRAADANRSCPNRTPSRQATSPTVCRYVARRECRSARRGRPPEGGRLSGRRGPAVTPPPRQPTIHPVLTALPCAQHTKTGFVRCS